MLAAAVLACQEFIIPTSDRQWNTLGSSLMVVLGSGMVFLIGAVTLSRYLGQIPLLNQLALKPPHAYDAIDDELAPLAMGPASKQEKGSGVEVGETGLADSPLRPAGVARFGDLFIDVVADGSYVEKGSPIRIIQISGNRIVVRKVEDRNPATI